MSTKEPTGYHRLTSENRTLIWRWRQEGKSIREIGRLLGKNASTISRELERNRGGRGYSPKQADAMARQRVTARASRPRKLTDKIWNEAIIGLSKNWSFEMVCMRAELEHREHVSRETLYRRYYRLEKGNEELCPLPRSHRKRHKRGKKSTAGRGHIPGRVDISKRPKAVDGRKRAGHWEGDLVCGLGGTGYLVTLAERKTRYTLVSYVATKETDVVMSEVVRMLGDIPRMALKTLTFDNGKEFANHKLVTDKLGLPVYYAKPYHSWERGTNENRNGIVRKVLPKGSSFQCIGQEQFAEIDRLLNERPMKCLKARTPREEFTRYLDGVTVREKAKCAHDGANAQAGT